MRGNGLWFVVLSLSVSDAAAAAPNLWDRARDPAADFASRVLRRIARERYPRDELPGFDLEREQLLAHGSAIKIELAGGLALPSVPLHLFYGQALIDANIGRDAEAREILLKALEVAPDPEFAADGWFEVAIASSRVGDFEGAREAYTRALETEWDMDRRARNLMNRAEEAMASGDLQAARQDYALALGATQSTEIYALAEWGLGVALARDGELLEGLEHVRRAVSIRFQVDGRPALAIDLPTVFYTPDYEIEYYRALAAMAFSLQAEDPPAAVRALAQALDHLYSYLRQAAPSDRWAPGVEHLVRWCERRLEDDRASLKRHGGEPGARGRAGSG